MPDFRLEAPFQPTGDQPQAIDKLVKGLSKGMKQQVLLGVTGSGKSYTIGKVIEAAQPADAGHRPQQDPGRAALLRVPRVLPGQRGRVLRLVLRLLPARGVPAALGHVHREGLVTQRRDRQAAPRGNAGAVRAPRHDHRRAASRASTVSAPRSITARRSRGCESAAAIAATVFSASWSISSTSATTRHSPARGSACAATRSSSSRRTTTTSCASSSSATRSRRSPRSTRSPGSCSPSATSSTSTRRRTTSPRPRS